MAGARFLLIVGYVVSDRVVPPWPGAGRELPGDSVPSAWVAWRLLGSNHREVARSAMVFRDVARCAERIAQMQAALAEQNYEVTISTVRGQWRWVVTVGDAAVATSSRLYHRQRECEYNWAVFERTAPSAPIALAASGARRLSTGAVDGG